MEDEEGLHLMLIAADAETGRLSSPPEA